MSNHSAWRGFTSGRAVGQEPYDEKRDPLETVNHADTTEAAANIHVLAAPIKATTE